MTSIAEVLQKVLLLTSNVDSLKNDVKRLNDQVLDLNNRVVRLEMSGDLIAEKAKNAALVAAHAISAETLKEVFDLRNRLDTQNQTLIAQNLSQHKTKGPDGPD